MKRFFKRHIAIGLIAAIFLLLLISPAQAAYWKEKFIRFSAVAGETVTTGQLVYLSATDGYAYLADSSTAGEAPAVGMVGKGGASGATIEIIVAGIIEGVTEATVGDKLYAAAHPGGYSTTQDPKMLAFQKQVVGKMISAHPGYYRSTRALIQVKDPAHEDWKTQGYQ